MDICRREPGRMHHYLLLRLDIPSVLLPLGSRVGHSSSGVEMWVSGGHNNRDHKYKRKKEKKKRNFFPFPTVHGGGFQFPGKTHVTRGKLILALC